MRDPAHTQKSARLSSHSSFPSLGKREISGSGSILNFRVSHLTQLAMSSVVQACGSTGTSTGEGGSLSVSESAAGTGVGGETDTGRLIGGSRLLTLLSLLLLLLLLLEVVSELEVDSSELEEELLLLLLRALRGRSLGLDASLVVFVSCAASRVVSAGVVSVVVVEVPVDAPTQFGRASWCMA